MKATVKPLKGIRIQILDLLRKGDEFTVEDMIDQLPEFAQKQIADNCYQAKQDGLLISRKDGLTGKPAYKITEAGKTRIKSEAAPVKESLTTEPVKRNPFQPQGADMVELRKLVEDGAKENARLHNENESLRVDLNNLVVNERELASAANIVMDECKKLAEEKVIRESELETVIAECKRLKSENMSLTTLNESMPGFGATYEAVKSEEQQVTVEQFMVRIPKHKPFVVKSLEKARQQAMRAAKITGKAEVFAMVPVGDAVRGAVWNQK
jgi:hypothetical protein